jgi:hypothetical protein
MAAMDADESRPLLRPEGKVMGERKRTLAEARPKLREAFIEKFGREPGPDDPLVFDADYDTPVPLTEEKFRARTLEAMRASGTPPHLVYAFEKTGFMVNEQGYKQMSPADRAEYDAAIKEYFAMERRTDPQWYAFASSRDDPSGERDLRFGFGDADDANEYLHLLNKRYDGRYEMRPLAQAMGNLLAYDEMPTEEELEDPEGPGFGFDDPAGWADIDPEMWEAWLKSAKAPEVWDEFIKGKWGPEAWEEWQKKQEKKEGK